MEKFEQCDTEVTIEALRIENSIKEIIDEDAIDEIFGKDTYVIGGMVRDVALGKSIKNADVDIMTRTPFETIKANLEKLGYKKVRRNF